MSYKSSYSVIEVQGDISRNNLPRSYSSEKIPTSNGVSCIKFESPNVESRRAFPWPNDGFLRCRDEESGDETVSGGQGLRRDSAT